VPVLSSGLHLRQYGVDPTAQSAVEARRELVADIARFMGVPTHKVNAPAGDSETYVSSEPANLDLVRFTLRNYIGAIEDAISDQLPGARRMAMDVWPLVYPTLATLGQYYQLATGGKAWMTPEEVRTDLNLPPIENPDELNPPAPVPVIAATGEQTNG
jgi:phage portal protein BeeE